jgi:hypothetical protein
VAVPDAFGEIPLRAEEALTALKRRSTSGTRTRSEGVPKTSS